MPDPEEKIVGHVTSISGSVVIADGIHADSLPCAANQRVILDLGKENTRIPVYLAKQGGHRFLLIPIDAAVKLTASVSDTVEIEDPVDLSETTAEEPAS